MGSLSLSVFIHLCAYFNLSLCLCLSVSLFASESLILSVSLLSSRRGSNVVVNVCCRPERLSPRFSMAESHRATLRSCRPYFQFETQ